MQFSQKEISVEYKDEELNYSVWIRPVWQWCRELLLDPLILPEFRWDAERVFKFNGERFERMIDEPWTGNMWWELQVIILLIVVSPLHFRKKEC
jgi:hypothetical protein